MNSSTINIIQAKKLGINELYLTYRGIGDNIILYSAAYNYFLKTGKNILLSMSEDIKELFTEMDYAYFIDGFSCDDISLSGNSLYGTNVTKLFDISNFDINPIFISSSSIKELMNGTGQNLTLWPNKHMLAIYCERLGLSGKIDICPQIILTEEEKKYGKFFKKNQISIMSYGLQKYKTWPLEKTQELVNKLKKQYNFVQIGQASDPKIKGTLDKRGQKSLRNVASILHNSDLFVGGIGGLEHLSRSVNCRAVIAHSSGEPFVSSYDCNINVEPHDACNICALNLRDPQHQICYNSYSCINNISVDDMIEAIYKQMYKVRQNIPLEIATIEIIPDKSVWMNDYYAMYRTMHNPDSTMTRLEKKLNIFYFFLDKFKKFTPAKLIYKIIRKIFNIIKYIYKRTIPFIFSIEKEGY